MSFDPSEQNPYNTPGTEARFHHAGSGDQTLIERVKGRVMAPAIALIVVGVLGILLSGFNCVVALTSGPLPVDPNAPEFVREIQKNAVGPVAAAIQTAFIVVNLMIIIGGTLMLKFRSWGFSLAASILAMVNFGSCCCLAGLPVGIWSVVILCQSGVQAAFREAAAQREVL